MNLLKRRLVSGLLFLAMVFSDLSPSFRVFANNNYEDVIVSEDQDEEAGEIELINDISSAWSTEQDFAGIPDVGLEATYDSLTNAVVATPAVAYLKEEITFEGLNSAIVTPGSVVDLTEGVDVNTENLNVDLNIVPVEVRDADGNSLPIQSENGNATFTVPMEADNNSSFTVAYLAVADRDLVEVINQVAIDENRVSDKEEFTSRVNSAIEEIPESVSISSGEELISDEALVPAVLEAANAVSSPDVASPSETRATAFTAFRMARSLPLASGTRQLITLQALPGGNVTFTHYTNETATKYSTQSQVGSVAFNGGSLPSPVNNAYIELIAPTKHLARDASGKVTGLGVTTGEYIGRVEQELRTINGEEHVVVKAYYKQLLSSTDAIIPYTVRFKSDRSVPEGYRLLVDANLRVVGENDVWKSSSQIQYGVKYEPQDFFIYANANIVGSSKEYSNVSTGIITGVFAGEPDPTREFVNPATAINAPMKFKLQTGEGGSPFASADKHKQRLIQTVELYMDIPKYKTGATSSDGGATRLAVFEEAANPDWTVVARDAQGNPTKVKMVVHNNKTPEQSAATGLDVGEVLRYKALNLKYPNLMVNHFNKNADSALSDYIMINGSMVTIPINPSPEEVQAANNQRAALDADTASNAKYGTTAVQSVPLAPAASTNVDDDLRYNVFRGEISSNGMFSKIASNTPSQNFVMFDPDAMGDTSVFYNVQINNATTAPITNLSVKDRLADDRMYYKSAMFRFWSGDWSKLYRIHALDAAGNRIGVIKEFTDAELAAWERGANFNVVKIDPVAEAAVNEMVRQVDEGTLDPANTQPVSKNTEGFEIEWKPGYQFPVGNQYTLRVELGFRDPYHMTNFDDPGFDKIIENTAEYHGNYRSFDGTIKPFVITDDADATIGRRPESISFLKTAFQSQSTILGQAYRDAYGANLGTTVGKEAVFRIDLILDGVKQSRWFRNPKIVEVLPVGLRYHSHTWGDGYSGEAFGYNPFDQAGTGVDPTRVELIEDYQGTGRQAVIFHFPDFKPAMFENPRTRYNGDYLRLMLRTTITDNALPDPRNLSASDKIGNVNTSLNRTFFTADNLYNDLNPGTVHQSYGGNGTFQDNRVAATRDTENTGVAGLIADEFDVDNDGSTNDFVLGSRATVTITKERAVEANKEIRSLVTPGYEGWRRTFVRTDYNAEYDYRFNIFNTKESAVDKMLIYDIFPYVGDSAYANHPTRLRGSEFRDRLRGAIVNPNPAKFKIYYSTVSNPPVDSAAAVSSATMGWTETLPADPSTVTAFKIEMQAGQMLNANETVMFEVPMLAPVKPSGDLYTTEKGVNYFTISYDGGVVYQASNSVNNYVLNAIPVEKIWSGGTYRGAVTAILKQNNRVYTDARYPDGKIVLDTNNAWKSAFVGIPSADADNNPYTYTVEEEGAGTGSLADFDTRVSGSATETGGVIPGFQIHNTAKQSLVARVEWIDGADNNGDGIADVTGNRDQVRPGSVSVRLERRAVGETNYTPVPFDANNPSHNSALTVISDDGNGVYTHQYTGLSTVDPQGRPYEYRIVEVDAATLNNYPTTLSDNAQNRVSSTAPDGALLVTNVLQRYPLKVNKLWNDGGNVSLRPQSIEVKVQRKAGTGTASDISIPGVTTQKTLTNIGGVWENTFTDLIKYDASGTPYDYSVVEIQSSGLRNYTTAISPSTAQLGSNVEFTLTNTMNSYGLSVETEWVDANNTQGVRPNDTMVRLVRVDASGAETPLTDSARTKAQINQVPGVPNKWVITYTNLPKYDNLGQPYQYKVVQDHEAGLTNYTTTYPAQNLEAVANPADSVLKIRNELILINKPVQKVWAGDTGNETLRPANVSFKLYRKTATTAETAVQANGADVVVTVDDAGTWRGNFTNLLRYNANGEEYIYSIQEQNVGVGNLASYKPPVYSIAQDGALVATNALANSITARIDWYDGLEDANNDGLVETSTNVDNVRPASVQVKLQRRLQGTTSFTDVPADPANPSHNTAITTVNRDPVTGLYTHTYIGMPDRDQNGVMYEYRIVESDSAGLRNYPDRTTTNLDDRSSTTSQDGTLVVSNYIQRHPLRAQKLWNDASNPALRPSSISFKVQRSVLPAAPADFTVTGVTTQKTLPNPDGTWTAEFTNLVRYDDQGNEFTYSVVEMNTPGMANYTSQYSAPMTLGATGALTVTNTLAQTGLTVITEWDDQSNANNVRPTDVITRLVRSTPGGAEEAVAGSERTLSDATPGTAPNSWTVVYNNLPKFAQNGQEYVYRVIQDDEAGLRNYGTTYPNPSGSAASNPADSVLRIKNTLTLITKAVQKRWQDDDDVIHQRPASLEFKLYRRIGSAARAVVTDSLGNALTASANPTSNGGWRAEFAHLLKYNANGEEFVYSVEELGAGTGALARYKAPVYTIAADGTLEVTNALNIPVIPARIDWVDNADAFGVRPDSTTVQLIRSIPGGPDENVGTPVTISAANNWSHRFRNTPEFDPNGNRYTYRIVELDHPTLNNYPSTRSDGSANRVFTLEPAGPNNYNEDTLVITNIIESMDIDARKVWVDASNTYGTRPNSVVIHLQKDGADYRSETITGAGDTWNYSFTGLPKFRADGAAIHYTIREEASSNLRNYSPSYSGDASSGFVVTNTFVPISVSITKNWVGEVHPSLRPASLNVGIIRNDAATPYRHAVMNAAFALNSNTWTYTFHDLVRFAPDGSEYVYTAYEDPNLPYYQASTQGLVLTNTYVPNPLDWNLPVHKVVHGQHVPAGERYVFELKAVGNAQMPNRANSPMTVSLAAGVNAFPAITYTSVGTHEYELREIAGNTEGYTYDTAVYRIRVNVTDPDGNLRADVSYEKVGVGAANEALFENTYVRPESDLNIRKSIVTSGTFPAFPFQIKVEYDSDEEFTYSGDVSGTLRSGDVILLPGRKNFTIHNMPIGLRYTVTEINHDGFIVRYHQGSGQVQRNLTEVVVMNFADGSGRNLLDASIFGGSFGGGGSSSGGGSGGGRVIGGSFGGGGDTGGSGRIVGGGSTSGGNTPNTQIIGPGAGLNPNNGSTETPATNETSPSGDATGGLTGNNSAGGSDTGNGQSNISIRDSASGQLSTGASRLNNVTNLTDGKRSFAGLSGTNRTGSSSSKRNTAVPKTSDNTILLPFIAMIVMGGFGFLFLSRRKRKED